VRGDRAQRRHARAEGDAAEDVGAPVAAARDTTGDRRECKARLSSACRVECADGEGRRATRTTGAQRAHDRCLDETVQ